MIFLLKEMNELTIIPLLLIIGIFLLLVVTGVIFFRRNKKDILSTEKFSIPSSTETKKIEKIDTKKPIKANDILETIEEVTDSVMEKKEQPKEKVINLQTAEEIKKDIEVPLIKKIEKEEELKVAEKKLQKIEKIEPMEEPIDKRKKDIANIAEITKLLEEDIEKKSIDLTPYEEEQEEKAVISYHELLKVKEQESVNIFKNPNLDNKDAVQLTIDSLDELLEPLENQKGESIISNIQLKMPEKRFKSSLNISPVFGVRPDERKQKAIENASSELEKTLNLSPLTDEIKKNDEFLRALKDLRNNL